jgi:hypothetical protein
MDKVEEKYYLELFKGIYSDFPLGNIMDSESPDFIVDSSTKKYGIELSRIFQNTKVFGIKPQTVDSISESITELVTNKLLNNKIPFLDVFIIFTFHKPLIKKQREILSNKIVDLIMNNLPGPNSWLSLDNDFNNRKTFPWEINSIRIFNCPLLDRHYIKFSRGGWIQEDMITALQDVIDKKNIKYLSSFNYFDENWLLIHTIHFSSACFFEPSKETLNHEYKSRYNKLFYMDSSNHKLYELKTTIAS